MFVSQGTEQTPKIVLDTNTGAFQISGKSIPEDSLAVYDPVLDELRAYRAHPQALTELVIQLEFFNTSSSKCLLDIIHELSILYSDGHGVMVKWYHHEQDEDMMEIGEDFKMLAKVPFDIISYNDDDDEE